MWEKKDIDVHFACLGRNAVPSYCKTIRPDCAKFRAALVACISPNIGKTSILKKGGYCLFRRGSQFVSA